MLTQPEYLPTTTAEMNALGWDELDVLLISGDAYVDSHAFGVPLLGRWLVAHGYRAGIVAQPRWDTTEDIARMGRPRLFAGISAGSVDSLIAHYTAFRKKRSQDAFTPGGHAGLRPNRASIVYASVVKQAFSGLPVVLGGIEASLRRATHYDFWSDSLRRSIVLDAKAEAVLYGMGEHSIVALAELFSTGQARQRPGEALVRARLRGAAYAVHPDAVPADAEILPSHEAIEAEPRLLIKATLAFERQMLHGGPCLVQRSGGRAVVFEPPAALLSKREMDKVYALPFTRKPHPSYSEPIPAVAMLEGSITSHRGCAGGCSFCSLSSHQGRIVQSRSAESILGEVATLVKEPGWKGSITDIGGPSSNMWNAECVGDPSACKRESCLYPKRCRNFKARQEEQADFLRKVRDCEGVNNLRVASGVRHDLALENDQYMQALVGEFTGGQLKIAPEHISDKVLRLMRKPPVKLWNEFLKKFQKLSAEAGKEQYIVPYLLS
ncbi:MAG: YgiQ family radical SAM protein [Planctomycetes bacterium]|nr:YgiQ family radical SAM protein [Planctomycetota bacterium]